MTLRHLLMVVVSMYLAGAVAAGDGEGIDRTNLKAWNAGPGKDLAKKYTQTIVSELEAKLAQIKTAKVHPKAENGQLITIRNKQYLYYRTTKDRTAAAEAVKREIAETKATAAEIDYPELLVSNLDVGKIGRLAYQSKDGPQSVSEFNLVPLEVLQVIDEKNVIGTLCGDTVIWFTTATTFGVVDDKKYAMLSRLVEVVGTKQYKTVTGGTKTVFHLVERTTKELAK